MNKTLFFDCSAGGSSEQLCNSLSRAFNPKIRDFTTNPHTLLIGPNLYKIDLVIEEIETITRIIQTEWFYIQSVALHEPVVKYEFLLLSRALINRALQAIEDSLEWCSNSVRKDRHKEDILACINCLSNIVVPFEQLDDTFLLRLSVSNVTNSTCLIHQYTHAYLELQYHLLILSCICGNSSFTGSQIEKTMKSLIVLCSCIHKRQRDSCDVLTCSCIKRFWKLLLFIIMKVNSEESTFWNLFNKLIKCEDASFSLYLLKEVSLLESFDQKLYTDSNINCSLLPNYDLLENKVKNLLQSANSNKVLEVLRIVDPLLSEVWLKKARVDMYQTIWEYYSKRLNISNKNYTHCTAIDFSKITDNILGTRKSCNEDFELFVGLLVSHLREHPAHWGKLKGRIYSQLGPNKLKELNESGIAHIMLLFVSLSSLYYEEAVKRILAFCEVFSRENVVVWNIFTAFMFQQVKESKSLDTTAPLMVKMLEDATSDNQKYYLINNFLANFKEILNFSKQMDLYQWLFFGNWLDKYLMTCYLNDLKLALEVLEVTLERSGSSDSWPLWEPIFKERVYPSLKKLATVQSTPVTVGRLCGKLCLVIPELTEAFAFFNSEVIPPRMSAEFLIVVLADYPNRYSLSPQQKQLVVQSWMRNSLLNSEPCRQLTNAVLNLDMFPSHLKSHMSAANDSLFALIEYLGSDIKSHLQSGDVNAICELSFGQIDKWVSRYLSHPEREPVVLRIYTFISLAFLHCGGLLYNPNKSSSPLTRLVQSVLLPSEFLTGKPPHSFVLNALKKSWPIYFEALVSLNTNSDLYLERTLRDMITKYMPYFPPSESPLVPCLKKEALASVLLEKLSASYFRHPIREPEANLLRAMKILKNFAEITTSLELMRMIVEKTLYGLFEVVIFHSQRNFAVAVIKSVASSPLFPQVEPEFGRSVTGVTEKHLALSTTNYFQLMLILVKFVPCTIKKSLEVVKQQVCAVERLRGVGFDKNLRTQFEKLESALQESLNGVK